MKTQFFYWFSIGRDRFLDWQNRSGKNWSWNWKNILKCLKKALLFYLLIILVLLLFSGFFTYRAWKDIRQFQIYSASENAQTVLPVLRVLNVLTFSLSSELVSWQKTLSSLPIFADLQSDFFTYAQQMFNPSDIEQAQKTTETVEKIKQDLEKIKNNLIEIDTTIKKSLIVKNYLKKYPVRAATYQKMLSGTLVLIDTGQKILSDHYQLLILLQNNDELRATGGFLGSYLPLSFQDGRLEALKIEDIYTPAGQIQTWREAPAGLETYLSGGQGWGLQDSNWWADLPSTVPVILDFLTEVDQIHNQKNDYQLVVTLNLSLLEDLLNLLGPLEIADLEVPITAENFATLARADRVNFFPGSQDKSVFLNAILTNLKMKLATELPNKSPIFLSFVLAALRTKDLQFYSLDPNLEQFFIDQNWAGVLANHYHGHYYYLVESNVGINKSNRNVKRNLQIESDGQTSTLYLTFNNLNQNFEKQNENPSLLEATHNHYVNYWRLYLPVGTEILTLQTRSLAGANLTAFTGSAESRFSDLKYSTAIFTNSSGEQYLELAALSTVWAEQSTQVKIVINEEENLVDSSIFFIQKQSGIKKLPVTIDFRQKTLSSELLGDQLFDFNPPS